MDTIRLKARAKINLGLDVVRRREDGYHEVRMVMQMLKLYDQIDIEKTETPGIRLTCNLSFLPTDERNIAYKAAKVMMEQFDIKQGVCIRIEKHIPVAAGMAGGSADAAAVMKGLNKMFGLGLSTKELMERGVRLGADVPYCIMGGTALAEGIGEKLTELPAPPKASILVAKPPIMVSTKEVYQSLKADELSSHPDIDGMIEALKQGSLQGITDRMDNVLETVTVEQFPVIAQIKDFMKEHGAMNALMSGSGPTVFGIYKEEQEALAAEKALREMGLAKQIKVTQFYNGER